jgi:hypothetical protein
VASEIMYVELAGPGGRIQWARIGRVAFSKTGRTAYYDGRELRGEGRAWYRDDESGDRFWIQRARADGSDRRGKNRRGSVPVAIDEDVGREYWSDIRRTPHRVHEEVIHA